MKVLQVIHGFPPHYMAGSEIYTHTLSNELAKKIDVFVFTRIENSYQLPYTVHDNKLGRLQVSRVNKPLQDYTLLDKYLDMKVDEAFRKLVDDIKPDIVHIGHLSHLSTNIVKIAKEEFHLPVVCTIHDFWLFCLRGQYIMDDLSLCKGWNAGNCYACLKAKFKEHLTLRMIHRYFRHMNNVRNNIDVFLSPSMFLLDFFKSHGISEDKLILSRYGFDKGRIRFKKRRYSCDSQLSFGFMGRIIPSKGIKLLLDAFDLDCFDKANLLIFGEAGKDLHFLKSRDKNSILFKGGYNNQDVQQVLEQIDVLVVPSLWYENSPLVIQEAFQAGVPVITADVGGMAELVTDGVDGYLFKRGDMKSLRTAIKRIIDDPTILNNLKVSPDKVRSIQDESSTILSIYRRLTS